MDTLLQDALNFASDRGGPLRPILFNLVGELHVAAMEQEEMFRSLEIITCPSCQQQAIGFKLGGERHVVCRCFE